MFNVLPIKATDLWRKKRYLILLYKLFSRLLFHDFTEANKMLQLGMIIFLRKLHNIVIHTIYVLRNNKSISIDYFDFVLTILILGFSESSKRQTPLCFLKLHYTLSVGFFHRTTCRAKTCACPCVASPIHFSSWEIYRMGCCKTGRFDIDIKYDKITDGPSSGNAIDSRRRRSRLLPALKCQIIIIIIL